jgi:hypothetical protein
MDEDRTVDVTNDPLTPGTLFDQAAAKTDLPPREGRTFDEYLRTFDDPQVTHCLEAAFEAAPRADVVTIRHWVRLADDAFRIWRRTHAPTSSS